MKPIVAVVGRPNVGKSTFFNRMSGTKLAIVQDVPGVTRDRLYADAEWNGREFTLVDTGGIEFADESGTISEQVRKQALVAINEADVILFMLDGKEGLTKDDLEVANILRRTKKPVLLAINKIEQFNSKNSLVDFYDLGLGEPIPISSLHGMNTGDLLDEIVKHFPEADAPAEEDESVKIAVIGRPNVGKSSLVNALTGEERSIVSDIPGTTRDAVDTVFKYFGKEYIIIDTAGMRRKSRIDMSLEKFSIIRALRAVDRADVVLTVIDATQGVAEQDKKILGYAHEEGKAIVIVVNKWDLVAKDEKTMKRFDEQVRTELAYAHYAPVLYVSALTKQRLGKVMEVVEFVAEQQNLRIATATLNALIKEATILTPPPTDKGKRLKILYSTQVGVKPPTFVIFVNNPELMHFSYRRYLENQFRKAFGFEGSPIRFVVRKREE